MSISTSKLFCLGNEVVFRKGSMLPGLKEKYLKSPGMILNIMCSVNCILHINSSFKYKPLKTILYSPTPSSTGQQLLSLDNTFYLPLMPPLQSACPFSSQRSFYFATTSKKDQIRTTEANMFDPTDKLLLDS